jgi:hypothetical protein
MSKTKRYEFACNDCDTEWMSDSSESSCPKCHKLTPHFFDFTPELDDPKLASARLAGEREGLVKGLDMAIDAFADPDIEMIEISNHLRQLKSDYPKEVEDGKD